VRTRRAYFDCRFGQLHVRTAFPATGGFDEQVTLFCLHPSGHSGSIFDRFLPLLADARSLYAPDLPGCGESDPPPTPDCASGATAISDLANDLRLRQIDVLGFQGGSQVAVELAIARPELVRRLVLVGIPATDRLTQVTQDCLVICVRDELADATQRAKGLLAHAKFVDAGSYGSDVFDAAPSALAKMIQGFLNRGVASRPAPPAAPAGPAKRGPV
jgi:pimeloyl-ACP methyl ester carboxylesterase